MNSNPQSQNFDRLAQEAAAFKDSLGPYATAIITHTRQGRFAVDPEDFVIGKKLREQGECWAGELRLLQNFVTPQSKVLVLGSHIGILTIPLAQYCAEVVAFEANPKTYQLLQLNLLLNNVGNCRAFNLAASSRHEQLEFILSRVNSGGSKRVPQVEWLYYFDRPETVTVQAVPVDAQIPDRDFDLVIMDIEGSEYFALQGMPEILSQARVLQLEFIPHHLRDVAGVEVGAFVALVTPHFRSLIVPSQDLVVGQDQFLPVLQEMFDKNRSDAGLLFLKAEPQGIQRIAAR